MIGRTLSHFRIVSRLGEGGMGVVFRAEDERLHRTVALKVLPPERLADEESRLRFVREARTAAAISHPNVAVVYEIDEAEGVVFIAMELIEGTTLRAMIDGKRLTIDEALDFGTQIAEGLAAAHKARIVHRDLKPDNVVVTADRRVKILDFGLAKLLEPTREGSAIDASRLTTISEEMTHAGRVMGTASYMSPEQVRGQPVDARSDLFAFGVLLYELVTGKRPFQGKTSIDVMTAILREEPGPLSSTGVEAPPELERIVAKCLEKDPADRYQDTRDLAVDLRRLKKGADSGAERRTSGATAVPAPRGSRRRALRAAVWIVAAIVIVGGGAWLGVRWQRPHAMKSASAPGLTKLTQRLLLSGDEVGLFHAALSPEGRYLAYTGRGSLFVREIATGATRPLPLGADNSARTCAWAPDGAHVYVRTEGPKAKSLWDISVLTGEARWIRGDVESGPWPSPVGDLVAFELLVGGEPEVWVSNPQGEAARKVLGLKPGSWVYKITWAPNGRWFAALRGGSDEVALEVFDPAGKKASVLTSDPALRFPYGGVGRIAWVPDGRVLYSLSEPPPSGADMNVWGVAVDPATGKPTGKPTRITNASAAQLSPLDVSADGKRLLAMRSTSQSDVYVGDLSPDGLRLTDVRRLTFSRSNEVPMAWMQDGRLLLTSDRNGPSNLFVQALTAREPTGLVVGPQEVLGAEGSPDGASVLYGIVGGTDGAKNVNTVLQLELADRTTRVLATRPEGQFTCHDSGGQDCVAAKVESGSIRFYRFRLGGHDELEIARVESSDLGSLRWGVSRDGSRLFHYVQGSDGKDGIRVVELPGGSIRDLRLEGVEGMQHAEFTSDGRALFVTTYSGGRSSLFRAEFNGKVTLLRGPDDLWMGQPVPSPDGHHLALQAIPFVYDLWLIEGF